jgi:sensor histidine kinase YesM
MKFLTLLFVPFLSFANPMNDAINTAKHFCKDDQECINVLAVELDTSYYEGTLDVNKDKLSALENKMGTLKDLCESAPDLNVCESYKIALMERYIAGITK